MHLGVGLIDIAVLVAFYDSWDTSSAIPSVRRRPYKFTSTITTLTGSGALHSLAHATRQFAFAVQIVAARCVRRATCDTRWIAPAHEWRRAHTILKSLTAATLSLDNRGGCF